MGLKGIIIEKWREVELMKRLKEEEAITEMEAITLVDTGILRKEGLKDDHVQDH